MLHQNHSIENITGIITLGGDFYLGEYPFAMNLPPHNKICIPA